MGYGRVLRKDSLRKLPWQENLGDPARVGMSKLTLRRAKISEFGKVGEIRISEEENNLKKWAEVKFCQKISDLIISEKCEVFL